MTKTTARRAVRKPFPTAPIGRCTTCSRPTYNMAALNLRCEDCGGGGVMASVAMQDWRRCPACQRTGKSMIAAKTADGSCPVCHGSGWITAAEYPAAESELLVQQSAVDNALDAATGQPVSASRFRLRSHLGSVARLAVSLPYAALRGLQDKLLAYQSAVDKRTADNANVAAPSSEPPRLAFVSTDARRAGKSSRRNRPIERERHLSGSHDGDAEGRQRPTLDR
jgi:hypothetical protein